MKKSSIALCAVMLVFFLSATAYAEKQSPEELVRSFYLWYGESFLKERKIAVVYDDAILKYVYRCTVNRVRQDYERNMVDADYFMKSQDIGEDVVESIIVGKAMHVTNNVQIVPVGHNWGKGSEFGIIVFVQNTEAGLRITKVESIYEFLSITNKE